MGINIGVYEYPEGKWNQNYSSKWWDPCRCFWDKEFISTDDFERVYADFADPESFPWRPKSFSTTRKWVQDNVRSEGNVERLLLLLDKLEENPSLWIEVSY